MKRLTTIAIALFFSYTSFAAVPSGYYQNAEGKKERALKTALHTIIKDHNDVGYSGLYDVYQTSDKRNGEIWDMYSTCSFSLGTEDRCGNYKKICDCYNREHIIPQSWFDERTPMRSDAFHVVPTDGKVNGMRSNYPHGETNAAAIGGKGLGKVGASTVSGYSGTVYEPADEYKGDIARSYFYFVTRYESQLTSFDGTVFTGDTYPALKSWFCNLMLEWHRQDPVSQKERDRQEAVYQHQENRNPFIDYPEMVEHIWGNKKTTNWTSNNSTAIDNIFKVDIAIAPNPTNGGFRIIADTNEPIVYEIFTIAGVSVTKGTTSTGEWIEPDEINKGIYFVRTRIGRQTNTLKLIVR